MRVAAPIAAPVATPVLLAAAAFLGLLSTVAAQPKVVLIAGPLDDHPRGTHEYEKTAILLAHVLDHAPDVDVRTEVCLGGWPRDPATLDDAATIVVVSAGADRKPADHPLLVGDRLLVIERQMRRGCGLVAIHWTTFVPRAVAGERFLDWIGGHFDYQSGPPPRRWASRIRTAATRPRVAAPEHPIARGLPASFALREEYYYRMRFRSGDPRLVPILATEIPDDESERGHTVAWCVEREDGGRGFGFTGGHFWSNWFVDPFRKMVLNAIVWSAGVAVPEGGVDARSGDPIRALIVHGRDDPAHDRDARTAALRELLERDPRVRVRVDGDPEVLAGTALNDVDALVLDGFGWQDPGLSDAAQRGLRRFVRDSGGGVSLIHSAGSAVHDSLFGTGGTDQPNRRHPQARRVGDRDGDAGTARHGALRVEVIDVAHPITAGAIDWETTDQLCDRPDGDATIEPLIVARPEDTGADTSDTGVLEPLAWANAADHGRVFQTRLGHDAAALRVPGTARVLRRALAWTARRRPVQLPGEPRGEADRRGAKDASNAGK